MLALYLFALGLGGVLLATSFFGGSDADDIAGDHDASGPHGDWQQIFSIRNATYFLFVFGAIGSILSVLGGGGFGVGLLATFCALAVASVVHVVFAYIRRTDTSELASDSDLVGHDAVVTLSIRPDSIGKIELLLEGKRVELLARPFPQESEPVVEIENGAEVVIVDMTAGTALVSRVSGSLTTDN